MAARFGFAAAGGGRTAPTVNDWETVGTLKGSDEWRTLTTDEQVVATVYLDSELGTLICALRDAKTAAAGLPLPNATKAAIADLYDAAWASLMAMAAGTKPAEA